MLTVRVTSLISIKSDQSASRTYNHRGSAEPRALSWTTSADPSFTLVLHIMSELGSNLWSTLNLVQLNRDLIDVGETRPNYTSLSNLRKLQVVQNALARRTVTCSLTSIPVSCFLFNLYWLPINKWISFKIATLTYKLLSKQQPTYLSTLISYRRSSSPLSFTGQSLLNEHGMKNWIRPLCRLLCSSTNLVAASCHWSFTITQLFQTPP